VAQNGYWDTVLWYNIVNQVVLLVTVPLFIKDLKQLKKGDYFHVSLSALFAGIGGITVIPAIAGNLGITMAILALPMGMVSAIVLSYFAPKLLEKHPTKVYAVRLASAAVMFAAGLALSR
jgi:ABC-type phosphate transport system permease subunit